MRNGETGHWGGKEPTQQDETCRISAEKILLLLFFLLAPWRLAPYLEGNGGDFVFQESYQGSFCDRDLRDGREYAMSLCCFQLY